MKKSIRKNLRDLRIKNNYTQEEFAEKLDISRSKVSSWENGKRDMNIKDGIKISQIFKVSLDNLLEIKDLNENEYITIINKFVKNDLIELDKKIQILEDAIEMLKQDNIDLFYERYKMTQNDTK